MGVSYQNNCAIKPQYHMTHCSSCISQLESIMFGAVITESEHKNNPRFSLGETAKTIKNIFLFFRFDAGTASYDVWIF